MSGLKKYLHMKLFLIILISLVSSSCSSIDYFNTSSSEDTKNQGGHEQSSEQVSVQEMKLSDLESQIKVLKKTLADLKLQIQNKENKIQNLHTHIIGLETKISLLEKNSAVKPGNEMKKSVKPALVYEKARNLFLENEFTGASALFTEFIRTYPRDNLAGNAAYWLGECHYSTGDYKKAINVFKDLIIKYPKSEKVPDALLKLGYSYLALDDSNRAHHYLKKVLTRYPFSLAADKAQTKLTTFE